ncbi:MAG: PAS domain S-box protein [Syntrophales bacterium]|nr:PAS domain S-box protein [Syntrophales bacterium]MDD5531411.1 PAS domain S-box protein [Syntrophales bacterium]
MATARLYPSIHSAICPVTGLSILSKPQWTDISIDGVYYVTFRIIGTSILWTATRGNPSDRGIELILKRRSEIVEETGLSGRCHVELRDYTGVTGIPSRMSRVAWAEYMLNESSKGHLQGLWVFGAPLFIRLAFQAGEKIYKSPVHVNINRTYEEAVRGALKFLRQKGADPGAMPRSAKEDWRLELPGYGISFELIGDDILYSVAHGTLEEPDVDKFFALHRKVLHESGLMAKGHFYRIVNWEKYERSTWQVRRLYLSGLKELRKEIRSNLSIVFGLNSFMKTLLEISRPFIPAPVATANDLAHALEIIGKDREARSEHKEEKINRGRTYTEQQVRGFADEMLGVMGELSWQQAGLSVDGISEEHPLKPVFDALALIKLDLDELLRAKEESQKSLQESEQKYRNILESVNDSYFEVDLLGNLIFCNPLLPKFLGYAPDEISGINYRSYMDRESARTVEETFKKAYREDLPAVITSYEVTRKDGSRVPVETSFSLIKNAEGEKIGFRGITRDATERRRAERALRDSEEKYRNILESIEDGYFEVDLAGRFTFFNQSMCTIIGYPAEEMPGMPYDKYMDERTIERVRSAFINIFETGIPSKGFEWEVIKKDGATRHLEVSVSLIKDLNGQARGFRGIARDVSERKLIELELNKYRDHLEEMIQERTVELTRTTNFLANIINSSVEGIITTDTEGTILHTSPRIEEILGYKQDEVMGKKVSRLLSDFREPERIMEEVMKKGEIKNRELRTTRKDGRPVVLNLSISLLRDEKGGVAGTTGIYRDVTEEKRMEEAMEQAILKAETANKAKSRFLANMSHEIRTPLNGIMGMTELCLETNLDKEQERLVGIIGKEARTLLGIVNDILDFAKIEAGKVELEKAPFDLTRIFSDLADSYLFRTAQKGVLFTCRVLPGVPVMLEGDSAHLQQVLRNLVDNAVKFTETGEIKVQAELAEDHGDRIKIRFTVKDTGIGIPRDKQVLIFDSFTQADGSTRRKYGGTGLGVTISRQLTELMGGTMGVESEEGIGSVFWFTAVFSRQDRADSPVRANGIREMPADGKSAEAFHTAEQAESVQNNFRLLLAEDYPTNQEIVKRCLVRAGYKVDLVEDGRQALEAFTSESYDLILMDIEMPVMDGFQAAEEIRKMESGTGASADGRKPRVPIIAMTGYALNEYRELCFRSGMDDFLPKPITRKGLLSIVEKWLPPEAGRQKGPGSALSDRGAGGASSSERICRTIDLQKAQAEFEDDRGLLTDVIDGFCEKVERQIRTIRRALAGGDAESVRREAHAIKGGAANLTAEKLSGLALELETNAKNRTLCSADRIVDDLEEELEVLMSYVRENLPAACN